jgi:hypothetical protein
MCHFGCASRGEIDRPRLDTLAWSRNIAHGQKAWLTEARKRFSDPFVFVVHGDTHDGKSWWCAPDDAAAEANITAVGKLLHDLMPDRDVVLVSCDTKGVVPRLPKRVWAARRTVWSAPRSACLFPPPDNVCSSIFEFVEGEGK